MPTRVVTRSSSAAIRARADENDNTVTATRRERPMRARLSST
jgi:hypothetical protein